MAQNYSNHKRFVPGYHFALFAVLLINTIWSIYKLVKLPGFETVMGLAMAIALIGIMLYARLFPLAAQDRIIRLEMRLRLSEILPADLKARIPELTPRQLVSLRFASDAELPDLIRQVLDKKIEDGEAIKKMVKDWQADELRV